MCCVGGLLSLRVKLHIGHLSAGNNPSDSLTDFFFDFEPLALNFSFDVSA